MLPKIVFRLFACKGYVYCISPMIVIVMIYCLEITSINRQTAMFNTSREYIRKDRSDPDKQAWEAGPAIE